MTDIDKARKKFEKESDVTRSSLHYADGLVIQEITLGE